jgi:hypothetical protein
MSSIQKLSLDTNDIQDLYLYLIQQSTKISISHWRYCIDLLYVRVSRNFLNIFLAGYMSMAVICLRPIVPITEIY